MSHKMKDCSFDDRAVWIICTEHPEYEGAWCYYGQRYVCGACGNTFMPELDISIVESPEPDRE